MPDKLASGPEKIGSNSTSEFSTESVTFAGPGPTCGNVPRGLHWSLFQPQQPPVSRNRGPAIQARVHVPDHRGNIGDHRLAEFPLEGFGDRLRQPRAASDV